MGNYSWVSFYEELATKLLAYKTNRLGLIDMIINAHSSAGVTLPNIAKDNSAVPDIDPFTVFSLFNRGNMGDKIRCRICDAYK